MTVIFGSPETWGMKVDEFIDLKDQQAVPTPTQQLFGIQRTDFGTGGPGRDRITPDKTQQVNINKWQKANPELNFEDLNPTQRSIIRSTGRESVGRGTGSAPAVGKYALQPLSKEGEKIAKKLYGTTNVSRGIRQRINRGEITMESKPRTFEKDKMISLKQKHSSGDVTGVEFPERSDYFKKGETSAQMEKRLINFLKEKTKQTQKGVTEFTTKQLTQEFPINYKQGLRLQQYYINKLGLKYAEPEKTKTGESARSSSESLKRTSSLTEEGKIKTAKTKILKELDMPRKIDFAHRVSKSYMDKLGLQFSTDITGFDSRLINQIIVQPVETELKNLYRQQYNAFKALERTNEPMFKDKLIDINNKVNEAIKKTSGRLVGVNIDPDTLEPSFVGVNKKISLSSIVTPQDIKDLEKLSVEDRTKFLNAIPKAIGAEIKKGFVPNDFKEILSNPKTRQAVLKYAKERAPDIYNKFKKAISNPTSKQRFALYSKLPAAAIPAGMILALADQSGQAEAAGPEQVADDSMFGKGALAAGGAGLLTKPGRQLALKTLQALGTPLAAIGFAASEYGRARDEGASRFEAATDPMVGLSLVAPGAVSKAAPQVLQGVLGLGKVGRMLTPVGIGLTAAGQAKDFYDQYKNLERMKETDPQAYEAFMSQRISEEVSPEQQTEIEEMGREGAMNGGIMRLGLKNGPKDPSKRKFIKVGAGILGALPFGVTKLFKSPTVQKGMEAAAPAVEKGWSWIKDNFWDVYNVVKNKGALTDIGKKGKEVRSHKGIDVVEDPTTIRVRYNTDKGNTAETVYVKPSREIDPETGESIEIPGDFEEYQTVWKMYGDEPVKDFEEEIIDSIDNVKKIIKED